MDLNILPGQRKPRFNPNLSDIVNKEAEEWEKQEAAKLAEEEARKEALEARRKGKAEPQLVMPEQKVAAGIEDICRGYEEFMRIANSPSHPSEFIPTEITDRYRPTKERVLEFSRALVNYTLLFEFKSHTATYLAALMQSSKDCEFELDLTGLYCKLCYLGIDLQGKKLAVTGCAGDFVGDGATDSEITVKGDAGNSVGRNAKNSKIKIDGNAGHWVGVNAVNSKIVITGTYLSLSDEIGGGTEIYQEQAKGMLFLRKRLARVYPK
jgi:hypothetical protein